MKKELFQEVFKKAEKQSGNNSKHGLSTHLEKIFNDDLKFPINKITFVRYYEKFIKGGNGTKNNPGTDLLNKASEYLDYKNYEDFVMKNNLTTQSDVKKVGVYDSEKDSRTRHFLKLFFKENSTSIAVGSMLLIGFAIFYSTNQQKWMVWQEDHYDQVDFNTEKYGSGQLKLYEEDQINFLKKVNPDCNTQFFSTNGSIKIWYGKNTRKELEFFTASGQHPETGKTLDPITEYMIKKYVCENY